MSKIETQHEIVSIVNDQIQETVKFFISEGWVPEDYVPSVRIDFLQYRSRSRGGRSNHDNSFVSLETSRFLDTELDSFIEYPRFAEDPEIGSVVGDRERAIKTVTIHEVCHALQFGQHRFQAAKKIGFKDKKQMHGHKLFWQALYRLTRRALVNPADTEQINPHVEQAPVEVAYTSPQPPLKRKAAFVVIKAQLAEGKTTKEVISYLVTEHGMKKGTAAVYVSQAGPGAGSRPRKKMSKELVVRPAMEVVVYDLNFLYGFGIAAGQ